MKKPLISSFLLLMFFASFSATANEANKIPEYTVEGLKLVPNTKNMALVWAEPGAELSKYDRVYLVEPYVAFKKNWKRDQNRGRLKVTTKDMEDIKTNVRNLFMEVFTEELNEGGYSLAQERAEDVLILKPAIVDLDVLAPDISMAGRTNTYTTSAGSMTLYLELYDSETDDLLAKALDRKSDRESAYMQWQTGTANRMAAKRIMKPWAKALREALDEARKPVGEETSD